MKRKDKNFNDGNFAQIYIKKHNKLLDKLGKKYARKLKSAQFDLALIPHRSLRTAVLIFLAGIKQRIGFNRSAGNFLFTDRVVYQKTFHEIERNISLLQPIRKYPKSIPLPEIISSQDDVKTVSK